jgi:hypothetical protein
MCRGGGRCRCPISRLHGSTCISQTKPIVAGRHAHTQFLSVSCHQSLERPAGLWNSEGRCVLGDGQRGSPQPCLGAARSDASLGNSPGQPCFVRAQIHGRGPGDLVQLLGTPSGKMHRLFACLSSGIPVASNVTRLKRFLSELTNGMHARTC